MTGTQMGTRTVRPTFQAQGPSGDGLSGLNGTFCDPQALMVAPGMLAGWAVRASLWGDDIALCDNGAMDAPFAGATGLTAAYVNRGEAYVGTLIVHSPLREASHSVVGSALRQDGWPAGTVVARRRHPLQGRPLFIPVLVAQAMEAEHSA